MTETIDFGEILIKWSGQIWSFSKYVGNKRYKSMFLDMEILRFGLLFFLKKNEHETILDNLQFDQEIFKEF